jgi:hypothetical protein
MAFGKKKSLVVEDDATVITVLTEDVTVTGPDYKDHSD